MLSPSKNRPSSRPLCVIEVLDAEPMIRRELIGDIADDAELRFLRARLHVVVADRIEFDVGARAALHAEELAVLLDVLLLVGVRRAGDEAELAEAVARRDAPVLAGRAVGSLRAPHVLERAAERRDLLGRVADVRREDAAADDLVVGEARRQRARAVVESPRVAAVQRADENALSGRRSRRWLMP